MWLLPSAFAAPPRAPLAVQLRVGHPGDAETLARDGRRIVRFEAIDAAGARPLVGLDGQDPAGFARPVEPGLLTLVYESTATFSELPAERFEAYLEAEGLGRVLAARQRDGARGRSGRELYSRSLKSLLRIGGVGGADRARGLPLELLLEHAAGGRVVLRLLWHGRALAGALVDLTPLDARTRSARPSPASAGCRGLAAGVSALFPDASTCSLRTGADGRLAAELAAGAWLAAVVHAEPTTGDERVRARWRTVFASLSFALDADGAG